MGKKDKHKDKDRGEEKAKEADVVKILDSSPTKVPKGSSIPPGTGEPVDWKRLRNYALIVSGIVIVAYLMTLWGGLVYNDTETLAFIRGIQSWDDFFGELWAQALVQPLTQPWLKATYAWDFQSAGFNSIWFHTVNIGLHLTTCLYLYLLVFRMSLRFHNEGRLEASPYHVALCSAAIFACHPMTTESVAYLSGRAAPLLGANYFLALNCFMLGYLGKGTAARFWGFFLSAVAVWIALMVDLGALTITASMIALAVVLKKPGTAWLEWATTKMWSLAAIVVATGTLPYLILRGTQIQIGNGTGLPALEPPLYWASQLKALASYYLRVSIVPFGLSVDPPWVKATSPVEPLVVVGAVVVVGAMVAMWYFRARPLLSFSLFLFLAGLIPAALMVQPELVADRRFYISLAGLSIIAGWAFSHFAHASFRKTAIACGAALIVLTGLTFWRNYEWFSNESLWRSAVFWNPDSSRACAILSMELVRKDKTTEAAQLAKTALKLEPGSPVAFLASGSALLKQKDYAGAVDAFTAAAAGGEKQKLGEEFQDNCRVGLAESHLGLKHWVQAFDAAQLALNSQPDNARLKFIAGKSLVELKQYKAAFFFLNSLLESHPGASEAWEPMAITCIQLGVPNLAVKYARAHAMREGTTAAKILYARALILARSLVAADVLLKTLLVENSNNLEALVLLDIVRERSGDKKQAQAYRDRALKIDQFAYSKILLPQPELPANQTGQPLPPSPGTKPRSDAGSAAQGKTAR